MGAGPSYRHRKGREAENDVCSYLQLYHGLPVERRRLQAAGSDKGDLIGWTDVTIQVKAWARKSLGVWQRELEHQMATAGTDLGLIVWKPNGTPRRAELFTWWVHVKVGDEHVSYGPFDGATAVDLAQSMLRA